MKKTIYDDELYISELEKVGSDSIFKMFENKTIFITGGTGLILSYFIDVILQTKVNCCIFLLSRNYETVAARFSKFFGDPRLHILERDLNDFSGLEKLEMDYVIAGASKTNPSSVRNFPTSILLENINGTNTAIKVALNYSKTRFLYLSTTKIYGLNENIKDENELSYFNPNTCADILGFSKLATEKLIQSYVKEEGLHASIARLSRTIGPTLKFEDSKDLSEYMFQAAVNDTIFLKTKGEEKIPFSYVGDVAKAIAYILIKGKDGKAYNVVPNQIYKMRELVEAFASVKNVKIEYSDSIVDGKDQFYNIESSKELENLGYKSEFDLIETIKTTFSILEKVY